MTLREQAVAIACEGETLVGVLAMPSAPVVVKGAGVVIVVGGPQYRAGSHRQFVSMARALAAEGHAVLRFDVRGMGDSTGTPRGFQAIEEDIAAAISCLMRAVSTVSHVVLWGLCDGASAALLYCRSTGDPRVRGLCLINPWVRSAASFARAHIEHYYWQRLRQLSFWKKLVAGRVGIDAFQAWLGNLRAAAASAEFGRAGGNDGVASFQERMAVAWSQFRGNILLVLSGRDLTAQEFIGQVEGGQEWRSRFERRDLERHEVALADHTFSQAAARADLEGLVIRWLERTGQRRALELELPRSR